MQRQVAQYRVISIGEECTDNGFIGISYWLWRWTALLHHVCNQSSVPQRALQEGMGILYWTWCRKQHRFIIPWYPQCFSKGNLQNLHILVIQRKSKNTTLVNISTTLWNLFWMSLLQIGDTAADWDCNRQWRINHDNFVLRVRGVRMLIVQLRG